MSSTLHPALREAALLAYRQECQRRQAEDAEYRARQAAELQRLIQRVLGVEVAVSAPVCELEGLLLTRDEDDGALIELRPCEDCGQGTYHRTIRSLADFGHSLAVSGSADARCFDCRRSRRQAPEGAKFANPDQGSVHVSDLLAALEWLYEMAGYAVYHLDPEWARRNRSVLQSALDQAGNVLAEARAEEDVTP